MSVLAWIMALTGISSHRQGAACTWRLRHVLRQNNFFLSLSIFSKKLI